MPRFRPFLAAVALLLSPLADARAQPAGFVSGTLLAPSDEELIFAYFHNEKTGLYKLNLATLAVTPFMAPVPGVLRNLSWAADGKSMLCVRVKGDDHRYENEVAAISADGTAVTKVAGAPTFIIDANTSPRDGKLFAIMAADFGHSSPLVRSRPRVMELYSLAKEGGDWAIASRTNAFQMGGQVHFDPSGTRVFLNLMFRNQYDPHGPYAFDVTTQALTSLIPKNMAQLRPVILKSKAAKAFLLDELKPVPSKVTDRYFLFGNYDVYQVDGASSTGEIYYPKPGDENRRMGYYIRTVSTMNRSDGILMLIERNEERSFRIIKESGERVDVPVNMAPYLSDFDR